MSYVRPQRRVAGTHDIRMDGMVDVLCRAHGLSVLDVGCNRGGVAYEFARQGASTVHGCDYYERGVETAREIHADLRSVESKFVVTDLTTGPAALRDAFGDTKYDIVVVLATIHKLNREMPRELLEELVVDLGERTIRWFCWRGTGDKAGENYAEMKMIDNLFKKRSLARVHWSTMSEELGMCAVWARQA